MENYMSKKIIRKIILFLNEYPYISFLCETQNNFGKEKKKICLNEKYIMSMSHDKMIPLFEKLNEKIDSLKSDAEQKKIM